MPEQELPDPSFTVTAIEAVPRSSVPTLRFRLEVEDASGAQIHFIALRVLLTVEPGRRVYTPEDRERLVELFGEPERWGSTTGSLRWAQVDVVVGAFSGSREFDFEVPCSYDHEVAMVKYFGGVGEGNYPLDLHFNGTTHYESASDPSGRMQILPLAWDRSARCALPVATWRGMIDAHYPRGAWLRVEEQTLRELGGLKAATGAPTVDECIRGLLEQARAEAAAAAGAGGGIR